MKIFNRLKLRTISRSNRKPALLIIKSISATNTTITTSTTTA